MENFLGDDVMISTPEEAAAPGSNNGGSRHGSFHRTTTVLPQQIPPHDSSAPHVSSSSSKLHVSEANQSPPPRLGLNLNEAAFLKKMLETRQLRNTNTVPRQNQDSVPQQAPEKLKALNFHASAIFIGNWKWEAINSGDLTAKCYFAKKKLVWEILELTTRSGTPERVKSKFEIQWSDVLSLSPTFHPNQPSELSVELSQPPTFYHETNLQPKRHTQWKLTTDFTNGHASTWRRHKLRFATGVLEKHYEKLVGNNTHLYHCSQVPFPSLQSPFFFCNDDGYTTHYGHQHHDDILHYPELAVPPQVTGHFPMDEGTNSIQNQFMLDGGSQFLVQDERAENVVNASLGTQANTMENLLTRRMHSWGADEDGRSERNTGDEGDTLLGAQMYSFVVQDMLAETGESSRGQEANQRDEERPRSDLEGNFQYSEISGTPTQLGKGGLHVDAYASALSEWNMEFDNTCLHGMNASDIEEMGDMSYMNFGSSDLFGYGNDMNIASWLDMDMENVDL